MSTYYSDVVRVSPCAVALASCERALSDSEGIESVMATVRVWITQSKSNQRGIGYGRLPKAVEGKCGESRRPPSYEHGP